MLRDVTDIDDLKKLTDVVEDLKGIVATLKFFMYNTIKNTECRVLEQDGDFKYFGSGFYQVPVKVKFLCNTMIRTTTLYIAKDVLDGYCRGDRLEVKYNKINVKSLGEAILEEL